MPADGSTHLAHTVQADVLLELGSARHGPLLCDLDRLLAGRCLVQGSSGAGKSQTIRRLVEEAFEFVTVMIVDPEGEFADLARHIGATTIVAADIAGDGLTAAAARGRRHRLPLHIDLSDLAPDERITKAAAFFSGLLSCPREDWAHTVLVAIDEAHLLAPHLAASARDAEIRRLGVSTLTELCSRGRKRGIGSVVATQRLAKLATSVVSELHNVLIGLNVFDRDVARAADLLGISGDEAHKLRQLTAGEFFAFGPALSRTPQLCRIQLPITFHAGATPELVGPADHDAAAAAQLLDLSSLPESTAPTAMLARGGVRGLDSFLLEPAAPAAVRIVEALRRIAPNATTASELAGHLGLDGVGVDQALDLLGALGAVDTVPKGEQRIARLSARLRLRCSETPVVGLA
ncbi:helicase HerA domain-containing protein [Caulobacter sp. S45]|uniref:helicase HerA domain-containing protein n=1 Tax=Caulobacter sp. S45 TaxID=1641861 RepID=UPI0015756F11|nr:DUF87 domain-containing protein [Caulobacter sp. S45]